MNRRELLKASITAPLLVAAAPLLAASVEDQIFYRVVFLYSTNENFDDPQIFEKYYLLEEGKNSLVVNLNGDSFASASDIMLGRTEGLPDENNQIVEINLAFERMTNLRIDRVSKFLVQSRLGLPQDI